jgi:hypothetical protein
VLDDARPYDNVPLAESGHRWVNGPIHAEITHLRRHTWTDYRRWDGQNVDDGDRTAAQEKTDLAWGPRDATSLSFTWTWRDIGTRVRVEARTLRPIASAPKASREYLATLRRVAGCLEFTPTVLARPEASAPPGIVTLAPLYQDRAEPAADFEAIRGRPMPVARANAAGRALAQVLRDYAGRPDLRKRAVAVPLAPLLVDRTVRKWLLADPKRRAARKAVVPEHILDRISSPEDRRRLAAATVQELAEGDHDGLLARAGIGLAERNEIVLATLGIRRAPKPSRAGR